MEEKGYSDIRALDGLENGIHSFSRKIADSNSEIEHMVDLYFQDFERGLQILEERLSKAEEAAVARCRVKRDMCKRDVDECRQMISDARTKRYIIAEKFSVVENNSRMALDKLGQIKEKVERHRSIQVPSSFSSAGSSHSFPSSRLASHPSGPYVQTDSAPKGLDVQRPRSPVNTNQSYGPSPSVVTERPRSPISESVHPTPQRPVTEADRPRSPFGNGDRVSRLGVNSFREGLRKLQDKYKDEDTDE